MKRLLFSLLLCVLACLTAFSRPVPVLDSIRYAGQTRYHYIYVPQKLLPQRPLVIMLHGYGGKADGYRPEMLEVAEREGFALCIPQGLKAPQGKTGWFVGYPKQLGMRQDDDRFMCTLASELCRRHSLNASNCFLTGMSNGGEMCYLIARSHPGVFSAIASIAGLTMKWIDDSFPLKVPVPFMEVHGTADKTSMWEGDPQDTGGWGAYLSVPQAVGYWVAQARCTHEETSELPLKGEHPVILHRYMGGDDGIEVRLYEVQGAKHSWHLADMDTCEEMWAFFRQYLK